MGGKAENPAQIDPPTTDAEAQRRAAAGERWVKLVAGGATYYRRAGSADVNEIVRVHKALSTFTSKTDF